jgi:hypothetical protein
MSTSSEARCRSWGSSSRRAVLALAMEQARNGHERAAIAARLDQIDLTGRRGP